MYDFRQCLRLSRPRRVVFKCRHGRTRTTHGLLFVAAATLLSALIRRRLAASADTTHRHAAAAAGPVGSDVIVSRHLPACDDNFRSASSSSLNRSSIDPQFARWRHDVQSTCSGRLAVYGASFARLRRVVVDRKWADARRSGGERIDDVMNQAVGDEFYRLRRGFFRLDGCDVAPTNDTAAVRLLRRTIAFERRSYLVDWLASTEIEPVTSQLLPVRSVETATTVALTRDDYANLYHTVSDWYNVFVTLVFFDVLPSSSGVRVLLVDAHPAGPLDDVWNTLFGVNTTTRLSRLDADRTLFDDLVWVTPGHRGPFEQHTRYRLPLVEQFRRFVLSRHQIDFRRPIDCYNVSVLLVWRRDYVTHPRNPSATVRRKIANERELEDHLRRRNPRMRIDTVQFDRLPFGSQLRKAAGSDVIVGMHGAGLTHALFTPPGSALIELMPGYKMAANWHFRAIARWRGLVYENWIGDQYDEDALGGYKTRVSPEAVDKLLQTAVRRMCRTHWSTAAAVV